MTRFKRTLQPELMDDPDLPASESIRALTDLDRATRWLFGDLSVRRTLLPRILAGRRPHLLLDLGTGSGLVGHRLAEASEQKGVRTVVIGIDRKLEHLVAGRRNGHHQHRIVADVDALPIRDGAVDSSLSTLLVHHFGGQRNRRILGEMMRVARQRAVIIDLRRSRFAAVLRPLFFSLLRIGRVAAYDGRLSLMQAWSVEEVRELATGFNVVELRDRFPFRFSLVIDTPVSTWVAADSSDSKDLSS